MIEELLYRRGLINKEITYAPNPTLFFYNYSYPDYGWRQANDRNYGNACVGEIDDGESVLANRTLLEKLFADPDFDMMTGYSRSTGKRVFPKYYDKDGNELEDYQFRFGTPYSGYIGIIKQHVKPESLEIWKATRAKQRNEAVERVRGKAANPATRRWTRMAACGDDSWGYCKMSALAKKFKKVASAAFLQMWDSY